METTGENKQTTMEKRRYRILISGGGTGGHIFPALSIAGALKQRTDAEILFVGAENRMEMEKVPAAGYEIKGLPVAGFNRRNPLKNIGVLLKLRKSMVMARRIVKEFRPDIAIGVGGYASGPTLRAAQKAGIPTLLQEQNSYAGVTNRLLSKKADRICVAYDGMERFFPAGKIVKTGNPVRQALMEKTDRTSARKSFGLDADKPTVLVVGGSLGARTLNLAMEAGVKELSGHGIQVIWQTGKNFGERGPAASAGLSGVTATKFITDMAKGYAAADLVVSRAGAGSISEIELLGKPSILVPSPNVAEDHQTRNARALSDAGAALMLPDAEAVEKLIPLIIKTISSEKRLNEISAAVKGMALPGSAGLIADEVIKLMKVENEE